MTTIALIGCFAMGAVVGTFLGGALLIRWLGRNVGPFR